VRSSGSRRSRQVASPADDWRIGPTSLALSGLIRGLAATVELCYHDDATVRSWEQQGRPFILAFWHRYLILMRYAYFGSRMSVLVSQSWDGELTAQTLAHLGIDTCRGSTSQGGAAALRDLLRRARHGSDLAFTPDGPRGPLRKVQPGVIVAAALSGLPIQPVAIGATRRKLLRSWDRMLVPLPGARVDILFGTPLVVGPRSPIPDGVDRLEQALYALDARAAEISGWPADRLVDTGTGGPTGRPLVSTTAGTVDAGGGGGAGGGGDR
jgi:lysophospholipid acyltransferase (LPLAT)-like uncharacterized protein